MAAGSRDSPLNARVEAPTKLQRTRQGLPTKVDTQEPQEWAHGSAHT